MAADDNTGTKMAAVVALGAVLLSPRVRGTLRGVAVHGLAGMLAAGDALSSFARGVSRGMQDTNASPAGETADGSVPTPEPQASHNAEAQAAEAGNGATAQSTRARRRRAGAAQTLVTASGAEASGPAETAERSADG